MLSPELKPMINALADKNNNIILSDLPLSIQNLLAKEGIILIPKVDKLSKEEKGILIPKDEILRNCKNIKSNDIDSINSDEVSVNELTPSIYQNLIDQGVIDKYRRKNGIDLIHEWFDEIPEEISNLVTFIL